MVIFLVFEVRALDSISESNGEMHAPGVGQTVYSIYFGYSKNDINMVYPVLYHQVALLGMVYIWRVLS